MNSREQADHDERLDGEPGTCPVCESNEDGEPCGPDCAAIYDEHRARVQRARLYAACWEALRFARTYAFTSGPDDFRVLAIMRRVHHLRVDIAELRKPRRAA